MALTDYLKKYAATTRVKVDMELADRFDYQMRQDGDKPIKQQMAKARRAASTLQSLLADFKELPDKQVQELKSSAASLRNLADSLEGLSRFAKGYQTYYLAELQREEDAVLDAFALQRWGTDTTAAKFEWDLITELGTTEGAREIGRWMHGHGRYTQVKEENFHSPFQQHRVTGKNIQRDTAKCIKHASEWMNQHTDVSYGHCHMGMRDYELFLEERKAAASLAKNIMQAARVGGQGAGSER